MGGAMHHPPRPPQHPPAGLPAPPAPRHTGTAPASPAAPAANPTATAAALAASPRHHEAPSPRHGDPVRRSVRMAAPGMAALGAPGTGSCPWDATARTVLQHGTARHGHAPAHLLPRGKIKTNNPPSLPPFPVPTGVCSPRRQHHPRTGADISVLRRPCAPAAHHRGTAAAAHMPSGAPAAPAAQTLPAARGGHPKRLRGGLVARPDPSVSPPLPQQHPETTRCPPAHPGPSWPQGAVTVALWG